MPHKKITRRYNSLLLYGLIMAVFFCGCQGSVKPQIEPTETVATTAPLDSLRGKFQLTLWDSEGKQQELDGVLFSVPGLRYRMELTGPMGIGVASMLWLEEGWVITFPTEKLYAKGRGYMVGLLNDNSFPLVHIHQVAGIFNGQLLPQSYELTESGFQIPEGLNDSLVEVIYGRDELGKTFAFGKENSNVVWLCRSGRDGKMEVLRFLNYKEFEGKFLPSEVVFERDGTVFLKIRMKKITHNKAFSLGIWRLNVPKSYSQIGL